MARRVFKTTITSLTALLAFSISACANSQGGGGKKKVDPVKASRVYVASLACELFVDSSYTVNPVVFPFNATKNVKYEIEKSNVLYAINNTLYGSDAGTSLVYVYNDDDNDNVRDSDEAFTVMAFDVTYSSSSIYFVIDEEITISVDESKKLNYEVKGATPSGLDFGFYSEDESVCTISSGTVKGHKAGKTRVSVSWQGYRGYCTVNVIDRVDEKGLRASSITSDDSIVLNKGQSKKLSYKILPAKAVDKLASVTSNNEKVVKVNEDKSITALMGGSAVITLTTENNKLTRVLVTVKDNANNEDSYYNNYYGDLTWENGEDLKQKLHDIISKNVTPLKYDSPNWETNQNADQSLYDYSYVKGVYNDNEILKADTNSGWQREHAFAASLMTGFSTGSAVKSLGRSTDFHNLFAASAGANGSRGNKNYGYVNLDSAELNEKENCLYTRKAWEPDDSDKGRLARAIFYMDVMYNKTEAVDISETWTYRGQDTQTHTGTTKSVHVNANERALQIVEENVDYSRISLNDFMAPNKNSTSAVVNYYRSLIREEYPELENDDYDTFRELAYERYLNEAMPYAIGHRSDLLKWTSFPVDHLEVQHNNSVYSYYSAQGKGTQGNRNPFVDYPELINFIYGDLKDTSGSLKMLTPTYLTLEMDKDEIHHYSVESGTLKTFESGTKPTVDDFNIKAIKNDLSVGVLDKSKIQVEDYTFTDDDVENGKDIMIYTDKNTLKVHVNVTSDSVITFDTCNWSYLAPNKDASSVYKGEKKNFTATLNGIVFDVTSKNDITLSNRNTDCACRFGTTSAYADELTFTTKEAVNISGLTKVNAVFFNVACGSSKTFKYTISIGETVIANSTCTGTFKDYGAVISEPLEGKLTIAFTDVKSYMDVHGFAINAIE